LTGSDPVSDGMFALRVSTYSEMLTYVVPMLPQPAHDIDVSNIRKELLVRNRPRFRRAAEDLRTANGLGTPFVAQAGCARSLPLSEKEGRRASAPQPCIHRLQSPIVAQAAKAFTRI
jgi:hypothetical protein